MAYCPPPVSRWWPADHTLAAPLLHSEKKKKNIKNLDGISAGLFFIIWIKPGTALPGRKNGFPDGFGQLFGPARSWPVADAFI
jgi:hypothetical protein